MLRAAQILMAFCWGMIIASCLRGPLFPYYFARGDFIDKITAHVYCLPYVQWDTDDWLPRFTNKYRNAFGCDRFFLLVRVSKNDGEFWVNQNELK